MYFNCPHNSAIKCDVLYQFNEIYRQLDVAFKAGKVTIFYGGEPDSCTARPADCPRYQVAIPDMIKRIEANQKQ